MWRKEKVKCNWILSSNHVVPVLHIPVYSGCRAPSGLLPSDIRVGESYLTNTKTSFSVSFSCLAKDECKSDTHNGPDSCEGVWYRFTLIMRKEVRIKSVKDNKKSGRY